MKKCMYCSKEMEDENIIDICTPCGHGVWGEKMFSAIKENMQNAKNNGDLHQGNVGEI